MWWGWVVASSTLAAGPSEAAAGLASIYPSPFCHCPGPSRVKRQARGGKNARPRRSGRGDHPDVPSLAVRVHLGPCARLSARPLTLSRICQKSTERLLLARLCSGHRRGEGSASWSFSLEEGNRYRPSDHTDEYSVVACEMCSERGGRRWGSLR